MSLRRLFGHKEAYVTISFCLLWLGLVPGLWPAFIVYALLSVAYIADA